MFGEEMRMIQCVGTNVLFVFGMGYNLFATKDSVGAFFVGFRAVME
jgi:hypothetical protein